VPIISKEPESLPIAYERCIKHIEEFINFQKKYLEFLRNDKNNKKFVNSSAYKYALMQTICLVGDTLTWFRPGQFGRDFKDVSPKVRELARNFNDEILTKIINLRNLYAHNFLYEDQKNQIEKFKELLTKELVSDLNLIKNTMQTQLSAFTEQEKTLTLVGQIQSGFVSQDPLECSKLMVEELKLLNGILKQDKDQNLGISRAIDCHIKNICQLYKDYKQTLQKQDQDIQEKEASSNAQIVSDPNMADVFAILERSKLLRDWLAHPNMNTISQEAIKLREQFKQQLDYLLEFCKQKFDVIYKLTMSDSLTSNPSEFLVSQDNKFHKDIPQLDDLALTDETKLVKCDSDKKTETSLSEAESLLPKKKKQKMEPSC
jgi:hypothetical protein